MDAIALTEKIIKIGDSVSNIVWKALFGTVVFTKKEYEMQQLERRKKAMLLKFGEDAYKGYEQTGKLEIPAEAAAEIAEIEQRIRQLKRWKGE